jgi:hypothetical protein
VNDLYRRKVVGPTDPYIYIRSQGNQRGIDRLLEGLLAMYMVSDSSAKRTAIAAKAQSVLTYVFNQILPGDQWIVQGNAATLPYYAQPWMDMEICFRVYQWLEILGGNGAILAKTHEIVKYALDNFVVDVGGKFICYYQANPVLATSNTPVSQGQWYFRAAYVYASVVDETYRAKVKQLFEDWVTYHLLTTTFPIPAGLTVSQLGGTNSFKSISQYTMACRPDFLNAMGDWTGMETGGDESTTDFGLFPMGWAPGGGGILT